MANPNIVNVANIFGKTVVQSLTGSYASVLANAASSGKVLKVNTIIASNITAAAKNCYAKVVRSSTDYMVANQLAIPTQASLVLISKDTSIYLEEGDDLQMKADATSEIQVTLSYEEIS